jgi:hypothetical protein
MFEESYQIVLWHYDKSGHVCTIEPICIGGFRTSRHVQTCFAIFGVIRIDMIASYCVIRVFKNHHLTWFEF